MRAWYASDGLSMLNTAQTERTRLMIILETGSDDGIPLAESALERVRARVAVLEQILGPDDIITI